MVNNPRHPHSLQILRELLDEEGNTILDEEQNPITEVVFESVCRAILQGKAGIWGMWLFLTIQYLCLSINSMLSQGIG